MVTVALDALREALDFISIGPPGENLAYVSLDTGEIWWVSLLDDRALEVPDDLETSDRYVLLDDKNELGLGRSLVARFADEVLPEERERILELFERRGAWARFRNFLAEHGARDRWDVFEELAIDAALRAWCREHGLEPVEDDGPTSPLTLP